MALVFVCTPGLEGTDQSDSGLLSGGSDPFPTCADGGTWLDASSFVQQGLDFHISQLNPDIIAAAFGAGFVLIATAFVLGRTIGAVLQMIGR